MRHKILVLTSVLFLSAAAHAEVAIETAVSRSILPVGEQLTLDIIISNAQGRIESPKINSIDGFTSYSQGHQQEFSMINGQTSSRSIYTYVLVANSEGQKTIGPFQIVIGGKEYKVAPVKVEVTKTGAPQGGYTWQPQTPVSTPPQRAMPSGNVGDQDVFVKAWIDKDEVWVGEAATVTYTMFTRLSATFKGFDKEPVTTGFWVEDFPPEKTIRRTEQFLNGQRYVVADVRKMALFPTQSGVFTIDPGVLAATVEVRSDQTFQTFVSGNIFGSRRGYFPGQVVEIVPKSLKTDAIQLTAKTLPETGKPQAFSGAVGQYEIESSIDKDRVEAGDPITLRVRVKGKGNINTLKMPKLPLMDDFKVYDSSTSTNVQKEKLIVEGERITETVIVPRKPGTYEIPAIAFIFFDPVTGAYQTVRSDPHKLVVTGTIQPDEPVSSSAGLPASGAFFGPETKEDVDLLAQDIRYIKTSDPGRKVPTKELYRDPFYWLGMGLLFFFALGTIFLSGRRTGELADVRDSRLRRSHAAARAKLKAAGQLMKGTESDPFYAEISRAVTGYFADKFNLSPQGLSLERVEELAKEHVSAEHTNRIKKLFHEMSMGRFARTQKSREEMKELYDLADEVITDFEKVKLK
jgi:hypothetical protein